MKTTFHKINKVALEHGYRFTRHVGRISGNGYYKYNCHIASSDDYDGHSKVSFNWYDDIYSEPEQTERRRRLAIKIMETESVEVI